MKWDVSGMQSTHAEVGCKWVEMRQMGCQHPASSKMTTDLQMGCYIPFTSHLWAEDTASLISFQFNRKFELVTKIYYN